MPLCKVGGLAAFAEQDHLGTAFLLGDRLDQIPVAQVLRRTDTRVVEKRLCVLEDGTAARKGQFRALLIETGQLLQ